MNSSASRDFPIPASPEMRTNRPSCIMVRLRMENKVSLSCSLPINCPLPTTPSSTINGIFGSYRINDVGHFFDCLKRERNISTNFKITILLVTKDANYFIELKRMIANDYHLDRGVGTMDKKSKLIEIAMKNGFKKQITAKIHDFNEQDVDILHNLIDSLDDLHYSGAEPFFLFINIGGIDFLFYDIRIKLHNLITKEPKVMCNEYNSDAVSVGTQTAPVGFPTRCNICVPYQVLRFSNGNKICDNHPDPKRWFCTGISGTGCGWKGVGYPNSYSSATPPNCVNQGDVHCTTCQKCRGA
jgi:hypothetical protein